MRSRVVLLSVVTVIGATLTACGDDGAEPSIPAVTQSNGSLPEPTPSDPPADDASGSPQVTGTVASGLSVPWGIAFLPDGDALVTERETTRVLRLPAEGDPVELGTIDEAEPEGESGLLGIAVSPDFDQDRQIFLYVTTGTDNRILRLGLEDDRLGTPQVILDDIPEGSVHDGGRLAFGPDGHLYVSTGEAGTPDLSQDPDSLGGKILRITPDGDPAPGNPDPASPIWTSGHRNVQGLAWDDRGRLWASEFGAQTRDELNLIEPGGNYGWPQVEGVGGDDRFTDPQLVWPVEQASPSGLAYAQGHLWMGGLRGERLWRIDVRGARAQDAQDFFTGEYGRLRTVVAAPDGSLWVTTSNRDGRGDPAPDDDRILRVTP